MVIYEMDEKTAGIFKTTIDKWFEGFEKEVRQKIIDLGDTTIRSMHDNVKGKIAAQNRKEILEEILGE